MFNFTLHVCTNFSYCEHWCASQCWCSPIRHNNPLSCNENRKHFKPCCKHKLNMRKANGKKCLQAYFASSEWPHHNIQSDCIKNNVLMSTNQISAPFKDCAPSGLPLSYDNQIFFCNRCIYVLRMFTEICGANIFHRLGTHTKFDSMWKSMQSWFTNAYSLSWWIRAVFGAICCNLSPGGIWIYLVVD